MASATADLPATQQASHTLEEVLPLLLTHQAAQAGSSHSKQRALLQMACTLLSCSHSCSDAIRIACSSSGLLSVQLTPKDSDHAEAFADWMLCRQHAQLLASLDLSLSKVWLQEGEAEDAAEAQIAFAMTAAADAGELQLREFSCRGPPGRLLLQHLPASSLTSLTVDCSELQSSHTCSSCGSDSDVEWLQQQLMRLTCLQRLQLAVSEQDERGARPGSNDHQAGTAGTSSSSSSSSRVFCQPECIFPALSQLGQPTKLHLERVGNATALSQLPAQLRELELTFASPAQQQQQQQQQHQGGVQGQRYSSGSGIPCIWAT
uniref:Uncharacterized protein n=1 Tax=Tetradesmus obliquus TaxID=3088 RepID=A0A383VU70_TETOB|eukprot:jgi/Sobl393_1/7872/SZX68751.1